MFFILSKLFGFLLQPIGLLLIASFLIYRFRKNHTKVKMLALFIIFLTYLLSTLFTTKLLIKLWEPPFEPIERAKPKDYAVVLTGGIIDEDFCRGGHLQVGHTFDRLWQAIHLYQEGKIERILISGGDIHLINKNLPTEASCAEKLLLQNNIPQEAIFVERFSKNTYENAVYTSKFLEENNWSQNGYLITSAFHMKRAERCFLKQNLQLTPFASGYMAYEQAWSIYDFIPRAYFLAQSEKIWKEVVAFGVYKAKGYI